MAQLANYYAINSGELDHIIYQGLTERRKWHKLNSHIRAINLAHCAELKPYNWTISVGREPTKLHETLKPPSLQELIRPLYDRGAILAEGEYREWEYLKRLFFAIPQMREIDEETIEDYIFFTDQVINNIIKRVYGRWYAPGAGLREIPKFFPDLEELFIPFINDFPNLKGRLPFEISLEFFYAYDPERRVVYIPSSNVAKLQNELSKRKDSLIAHFLMNNWEAHDIENVLLPFFNDIFDYAKKNKRAIMIRY